MFKIPTTRGEGNHHPGFTAAAGTPAALAEARTAGKSMAMACLDLLLDPALVDRAKAEFAETIRSGGRAPASRPTKS